MENNLFILQFICSSKNYSGSYPAKTVVCRRSVENVFLKISQNSQENTCAGESLSQ